MRQDLVSNLSLSIQFPQIRGITSSWNVANFGLNSQVFINLWIKILMCQLANASESYDETDMITTYNYCNQLTLAARYTTSSVFLSYLNDPWVFYSINRLSGSNSRLLIIFYQSAVHHLTATEPIWISLDWFRAFSNEIGEAINFVFGIGAFCGNDGDAVMCRNGRWR